MKTTKARRRHPAFAFASLLLALTATGGAYALVTAGAQATPGDSAAQVDHGRQLFQVGCSTCHGTNGQGVSGQGPSLIGVGAAAVDFQVSTGRMPAAANGAQIQRHPPTYSPAETADLAAYVASLGPGPAIPGPAQVDTANADTAKGGELFRLNCSQCHQAAGQGGALTQGKWAPWLMQATPTQMYEAMLTGPQSMPKFADTTLSVRDKQAIISYLETIKQTPDPGGIPLGRMGPVTEGLFLWTAGLGALIAGAVWIGAKAR